MFPEFDSWAGKKYTPHGPEICSAPAPRPSSVRPPQKRGASLHENLTTSELQELARDGHDILTTVFEFGAAKIKVSTKDDLSLISIGGTYSKPLCAEIEKISRSCRGNVGLEFRGGGRYDSSVIRLFKKIQDRCKKRGRSFFLCNPPQQLVDVLKLVGVHGSYKIVGEASTNDASPPREHSSRTPAKKTSTLQSLTTAEKGSVDKRMFTLSRSLKRTSVSKNTNESPTASAVGQIPRS